jgi:cleavage stimulation factor subunit 3
MKFARRAEGIKSGRMIFKKAREDTRTRHHVYVTAALMEYYCSKVSIEIHTYKDEIISFI